MKPVSEWTEDDLDELLTSDAEESVNLEFKRAEALEKLAVASLADACKTEISKDVSAFANSVGGTLIYGITEAESPPHQADELSPVDPTKCSKERLEQIINSRIQPRIPNLLIRPIVLGGVNRSKLAYVVHVPESFTVHQAFDRKYYKRFNFQSVPMEDYEIRQAINRPRRPTYTITLNASDSGGDFNFYSHIQNTSEVFAHDVSVVLLIPRNLARVPEPAYGTTEIEGLEYIRVLNIAAVSPDLRPFATMDGHFNNSLNGTNVAAMNVPVIVRVYDNFGWATEGEFWISLISTPPGQVSRSTVRQR